MNQHTASFLAFLCPSSERDVNRKRGEDHPGQSTHWVLITALGCGAGIVLSHTDEGTEAQRS